METPENVQFVKLCLIPVSILGYSLQIQCVHFLGYSLIRYVGHDVGQAVDPHIFQHFCNKKHRKPKFSMLFWSWWGDSNT